MVDSKKIQKISNPETLLNTVEENQYMLSIRNEIKRFEQLRNQQKPRKKDLLDN